MNRTHPRLGALKDPQDFRDFLVRKLIRRDLLPTVVDYEPKMAPVRDQGNRGSCVAFAATAVKEWQEIKQRKLKHVDYLNLSEEWVYEQVRQPGGGAYPRDAFKLLVNAGICREQYLPYNTSATDVDEPEFAPTWSAKHSSSYYKAKTYARLLTLDDMLASLAENGPFLLGLDWHDDWFDPHEAELDGYPMIGLSRDVIAGGHAVCAVGYSLGHRVVKFRNSWGKSWGKKGYCYITFDALSQNLGDSWASIDIVVDPKKVETLGDYLGKKVIPI